jgi:transcriptional regulator with XRE-family HTH domain
VNAALWTVVGSLAGVISAAAGTWQMLERRRAFSGREGHMTRDASHEESTSHPAPAEEATVSDDERRHQLGMALREARLRKGLSQEQLASRLPNEAGGVGVDPSWISQVEMQTSGEAGAALPSRTQLLAWARECAIDQDALLRRAKQLLPQVYPEKFIPRPTPYSKSALPVSLSPRDWHIIGPGQAHEIVASVVSLLASSAGRSASVQMTFTGPLLRALSSVANSGSVLGPLMRSLAEHLETGRAVNQLWSVQMQSSRGFDAWLRLLRDLLTLSGLPGDFSLLALAEGAEQYLDVVAADGIGGILILEQSDGFISIPVAEKDGASWLDSHFQVLTQSRHVTDLLKTSDWGPSPDVLLDWEDAMADADEAPGWRMLIQPYLGDVTCPAPVKAALLDRWRATCTDKAKIERSFLFQEACERRRKGLALSLADHKCYDVVSGPAFDRFVDHGFMQTRWGAETPGERLQHLEHLLELLRSPNYNLVIVKRKHDLYGDIFGTDSGTPDDRELYCLLKERGNDLPSVFTSTYFYPHQSRSVEIRHPLIFDVYRSQAEAVLTNLAGELADKSHVISDIKLAMGRISKLSE